MRTVIIVFFGILLITIGTRILGVNWDNGQHLNPDERFLTMVAPQLSWPKTITGYFDTKTSPLNPHNKGFSFYVYGIWPVLLVKAIGEAFHAGNYDKILIVGRLISIAADTLTAIIVFFLAFRLSKSTVAGLFAFFLYSIMVLPIQQAHFFTVDSMQTLFLFLTLYLLTFQPNARVGALVGISFALALATKVSAAPMVIIIILTTGYYLLMNKKRVQISYYCLSILIFSFCTFRIFMPYFFANGQFITMQINDKVTANWKELASFNDPKAWFPPGVQWIGTIPVLYPLLQFAFFGVGLPLFFLICGSILWTGIQYKKKLIVVLPIIYSSLFFLYESVQYAKSMRYLLPIYPALAVTSGIALFTGIERIRHSKKKKLKKMLYGAIIGLILLSLIWPISFLTIYTREHPRITASDWIYTNIPSGSTLTSEHWDDPLPLNINGKNNNQYTISELPMYAPENSSKWKEIRDKLEKSAYVVLSSNRVYGSTSQAPDRYTTTILYYMALFNEELGFTKIAEFTNRPEIPFFFPFCITPPFVQYGNVDASVLRCNKKGIRIIDDYADESFTVYDHPKVTIFKKTDPQKLTHAMDTLILSAQE
jgi:hypothetical protein